MEPGATPCTIAVCIKQLPDSAQIHVHPVTSTIMGLGVPTIVSHHSSRRPHRALARQTRR
ncbi:hypothetical protein CDO26_22615 (plasmid) [Sinorhizobium meliloti]|nr:hypothetical protein CDO26_22615 [Sinorhizobium meliloti]